MKTLNKIMLTCIISCYGFYASSQDIYTLDLTNVATYTTDCGTVNAAQWVVKNNHCSITSSPITIPGVIGSEIMYMIPITATVNSSGNLDCSEIFPDGAFIRYSIDNGQWYIIRRITACELKNKINVTVNHKICVPAGSTIKVKISLANNSSTEKTWIKNGDIVVGQPEVADSSNWYFRRANYITKMSSEFFEENIEEGKVSIYPNPAKNNSFNVSYSGETPLNADLMVFDVLGRPIFSKQLKDISRNYNKEIKLEGKVESGVYHVVVKGSGKDYSQTLIIE